MILRDVNKKLRIKNLVDIMPTFGIESNGRLEKTALYYNGEQLGGIIELMINIDEEGTLDAVIEYEGSDKNIYTKRIFEEFLTKIKISQPSFSEEEAAELQLLAIDSDGAIENTAVYHNDEPLDGIVSIFIHLKSVKPEGSVKTLFGAKGTAPETPSFRAEITFRNEDDTLETEDVF